MGHWWDALAAHVRPRHPSRAHHDGPGLSISFEGIRADPVGGASCLELSLSSADDTVTVTEIGFCRRGARDLTRCDYHPARPATGMNAHLALSPGETATIILHTADLCPSAELGGIYARSSRGEIAWLPAEDLERLVAEPWPAASL